MTHCDCTHPLTHHGPNGCGYCVCKVRRVPVDGGPVRRVVAYQARDGRIYHPDDIAAIVPTNDTVGI